MACRIQSIKPPCAYNVEGVQRVFLLDFEDFQGFRFDGDDLYNNCLVTAVYRTGDFVELDCQDTSKYTSGLTNGVYQHSLETFINALQADTLAQLHLASKRKQLVFFQAKSGRYFVFGYEAGASVSYANQTAEATGSLVTASGTSIYPLFEVEASALLVRYTFEFKPDFDLGAYCLKIGTTNTGVNQATIAYKVSRPGGIPLDVAGQPISESGNRQAIALMVGQTNPDATLYEVQQMFNPGDIITGNPTQQYNPSKCPVGFMRVTPSSLLLTPANPVQTAILFSVNPWTIISGPTTIATVTPTSGGTGIYILTVTRTATLGQGDFVIRDNVTMQTITLHVVNTDNPDLWVLDGGTWHMLGFWFDDGIWNY